MRFQSRLFLFFSLCAFSTSALLSLETRAAPIVVERIVAIVENDVVLLSEVERTLADYMRVQPLPAGANTALERQKRRTQVLESLISEKLLEQETKRLRVDVTDSEVNRVLDDTKARNNLDDAKFVAALGQQNMTLESYKEGIKKQLMKAKIVQLKVKNRVQVSDQDVRALIAKQKAMAAEDYSVRASHILFLVKKGEDDSAAKQKALAALARAEKGEDFAALASSLSEGPSASKGGDLGVFKRGDMVPEFEQAAFATLPGKVAGPIRTPFGWHVIKVQERVQVGLDAALNENTVRERLYQVEVEREFAKYVAELRKKAFVEIKDLS